MAKSFRARRSSRICFRHGPGSIASNLQRDPLPGGAVITQATKTRSVLPKATLLLLGMISLAAIARADDASHARAARLSFVQGAVTLTSTGNTAEQPAPLNLPLLAGTRLSTGDDGEAEVEFEDGSLVRLTPNSAVGLDTLAVDAAGNFQTRLTLLHGLAYAELRAAAPKYSYTIDAGGDLISPLQNATLRINLDEPPAAIAVLDGLVHVERSIFNGYKTDIHAGETLRADPADAGHFFLEPEIAQDSWDSWNQVMDQVAGDEATTRTAAREGFAGAQGYGWSDLDANGTWYDVPGQGAGQDRVWQPSVAAADPGFDPYGDGSWSYTPGTGYLWASAYPWGWTPYRCGGWYYYDAFGWGWVPGNSCGGFGWGFAGGGYGYGGGYGGGVNIVQPPRGYRPPRVPIRGPGPIHPVVPVHPVGGTHPIDIAAANPGPRTINGVTVRPLPLVGGFSPRTSSGGTALRRDYPVDTASHTPIIGTPSTQSAVHNANGYRPAGPPSSTYRQQTPGPAYRTTPAPSSSYRPSPTYTPAPTMQSHPNYAPAPAPPPQSHPAPAPASSPAAPARPK